MKKRKTGIGIVIIAFLLLLWTGILRPHFCYAEENKLIRVGYMDYHGFIDEQADGSFTGYGAEYLAKISEYTGFHYQYVYAQWPELLEMLQKKEIDLLCTAQYTPGRGQTYDFSQYPIGYTQGLLYTGKDNTDLAYEDFQAFNGMTVGVIENNAMNGLFDQYKKQHNFQCNMALYHSEDVMVEDLKAGKIDAICSEHLANHTDLSLLAKFGADAYYIISYKDSPYMEQINYALQQVKTDVDFEANLFHKYYDSSTAETTLQFTRDEKDFIHNSGTFRVGFTPGRAPFSLYNEQTGEITGICVDIMDRIAEESGLKFTYVPLPASMKTVDAMATGDFDIICGVEKSNFMTSDTLEATDAFLESTIVPVGRNGRQIDINGNVTAAVPTAFQALQKTLVLQYPNMKMEQYPTNEECLDAVREGKADIAIQNTHIMSLLLQQPKYESLNILPVDIMTEHTAMVIPRTADETLLSILNKSISYVGEATVSSSLIKHTFASPYQYTATDFIYKFRTQIIVVGFLVTACFVLLAAFIMVQSRNELKLQKKNAQLGEAVTQADRANVAKSQFLSRMSHEIRTPMNAIVGLTEIAKHHEKEPDKVDDYLNKIAVSSKVLLNIINDVLDMSAIESNKLKIANSEFDLKQVLTGISTIYYPQCESKGIKLEMATDVEHEFLLGDSLRVNQILLNFVSNAYKFTESGGSIRVFVKETAHKEQTAFLRFTISDTGCGMSADMQDRLFKPFEQETASTAKKHGGSGLGLSIAKNLIDMMHGAVTVESEKGKGTTFMVDLPFEIVQHEAALDKSTLSATRVLVMDDDQEARDYTAIVLQRIGVDFDIAESGQQGLDMIEEAYEDNDPYDVCLVDWKMPDMNGIEVTKKIRANEKHKTLIIIVSAYDLNEVEDQAKEAGADHFVSKPIFQSTVFNVLMTLADGKLKKETVSPDTYDFSGHRVLLAEDNEINAEIANELLHMVHMEVDRAANGQLAVEQFANMPAGTYCAILMDVQMPVLDGYGATREIRKMDRPDAKDIPIYAMTANAFTEDVSEALSAGMNGHIAKPIDTKILYQTLQDLISGKQQ